MEGYVQNPTSNIKNPNSADLRPQSLQVFIVQSISSAYILPEK
jgi:hypothetical protein